ncbi:uncharacterized protein K02A2.6-like [Chrysoperla carnea]|uniref:uncharacterized protein K02A2.6-like n=1 Tax=Chrysoperla carnea TaxID=189513 RepID=UPI001D06E42D|nr:uncharacterized protein K02A2.6-like [Chrysoperla carnea]
MKFRALVLQELHETHMGIVKSKALVRSYVWWPKIDADIEETIKHCIPCNSVKDNPQKASLIPWEWSTKPWQRLHLDYLGPVSGRYYSHSKWLEAFPTKSMSTEVTIQILRQVFARFGLPEVLVSDNYSAFESENFQRFIKRNGIEHKSGAPYYPASNGAAENSVKTIKRLLKTALMESTSSDLNKALNSFLLQYRNIPYATSNVSPAQALLGRNLRTRLDLLRPMPSKTSTRVEEKQKQQISSHAGKTPSQEKFQKGGKKWVEGKIIKCLGPRRRRVYIPEIGKTWIRHLDQLRVAAQESNSSVDKMDAPNRLRESPKKTTINDTETTTCSKTRSEPVQQIPEELNQEPAKDQSPIAVEIKELPKRNRTVPRRLIEEM